MYQPSSLILTNYADVLINFALNSGKGIKSHQVVFLQVPESAKPLLIALYRTVLKAGAYPIIQYLPDEMEKDFFDLANNNQIKFFPSAYLKGKIRQADHILTILAETNKHELEGVDPLKIMEHRQSLKPYKDWREAKEAKNKFTWTIGLYGTLAMAREAGLTLGQCWRQIVRACFLDDPHPVLKWRSVQDKTNHLRQKLTNLQVDRLHLVSNKTDLWIKAGTNRQWLGGDGRNTPSFEIFISPDWRGTEGHIFFDQPLYRDGNLIKNISLEFNQGRVVKASADYGQKILKEMLKVENADKVGEFSLTDKSFSRINRFMAETLYDENFGGHFGNVHLALGSAYKESYLGKIPKIKTNQWQSLGFNDSVIHTDLISTENRTVTAILPSGKEIFLYQNGHFLV